MTLRRFGFIVRGAGLEPQQHRFEMESADFSMLAVGVTHVEDAPRVAQRMAADGIQLIELCGAFGPGGTAAVLNATAHRVPVGSVAYGAESLAGLHALFGPPRGQREDEES